VLLLDGLLRKLLLLLLDVTWRGRHLQCAAN
jgi:hypothetical protein